ncbi:MAG TPA: hypothetical protein VFP12_15180 [Allosphingosinicella sp.]|nr:hypothetical protein [Allosphingosinicella sp.]
MRSLLIGAAGSALVLAFDLGVMHWGSESVLVRLGSAALAFGVFFVASVAIPWRDISPKLKRILSGIKSKGRVEVDAGKITSSNATEILSEIEAAKDVKIKVAEIES